MGKSYTMTIAGLTRELPLCPISDKLDIAAFVIFGDVPLTVAAAEALLKKAPAFDVLLTAEAKGIPLVYEMARQSGKPYQIARKYPKLYMTDPVSVQLRSITTDKEQTLYLDGPEMAAMRGRRVLIVDDVISTGESLRALALLVERAGASVLRPTTSLISRSLILRSVGCRPCRWTSTPTSMAAKRCRSGPQSKQSSCWGRGASSSSRRWKNTPTSPAPAKLSWSALHRLRQSLTTMPHSTGWSSSEARLRRACSGSSVLSICSSAAHWNPAWHRA